MTHHKAILLDLDGTVYRGEEVVPYAREAVLSFLEAGKHVRYLTNNSAARPDAVTAKLAKCDIPCEPEWVVSSGSTAAEWCAKRGKKGCFVIGEGGLEETFRDFGVPLGGDCVDTVVVGICRSFSYAMMAEAMDLIVDGACFIATNRDLTFPMEGGRFRPGAGSIVAAVEACSGVVPEVMGKPSPTMPLQVCRDLGLDPSEAIMVGDRLDTDIAAGVAAGCDTWLVLTGVERVVPDGVMGSADLRGLM